MAKPQTLLKVFVASPGDVVEERKALEDVINEFNTTWGDNNEMRLELVKWETHTRPGFGEDAQDVINKQIGDEYDIFIGIMWGQFGSPTKRAESGTEEEFNRAYSRFKTSSGNVQIMFYFKDAGIPPSKMNMEQLANVQKFKSKIASECGGLYHQFETAEEFRTKVRIHLSKLVQDWRKANSTKVALTKKTTPAAIAKPIDPLANLTALTDDDYDEGLVELSEHMSASMAMVVDNVNKIANATIELGDKYRQRTREIDQLVAVGLKPDISAIKRISNNAAEDLEIYVNRLSVEIPEFHKQHSRAMDTFGKLAMISNVDFNKDLKDIKEVLPHIQEYRNAILTSSGELSGLRQVVASLPRMTTAFNRARKRATAVMDDLIVQLRTAANQSKDIEELLEQMIDAKDSSAQ